MHPKTNHLQTCCDPTEHFFSHGSINILETRSSRSMIRARPLRRPMIYLRIHWLYKNFGEYQKNAQLPGMDETCWLTWFSVAVGRIKKVSKELPTRQFPHFANAIPFDFYAAGGCGGQHRIMVYFRTHMHCFVVMHLTR